MFPLCCNDDEDNFIDGDSEHENDTAHNRPLTYIPLLDAFFSLGHRQKSFNAIFSFVFSASTCPGWSAMKVESVCLSANNCWMEFIFYGCRRRRPHRLNQRHRLLSSSIQMKVVSSELNPREFHSLFLDIVFRFPLQHDIIVKSLSILTSWLFSFVLCQPPTAKDIVLRVRKKSVTSGHLCSPVAISWVKTQTGFIFARCKPRSV